MATEELKAKYTIDLSNPKCIGGNLKHGTQGELVYPIQAARTFGEGKNKVHEGERGGHIRPGSLSHEGDCWVEEGGIVAGPESHISGNARVRAGAIVTTQIGGDEVANSESFVIYPRTGLAKPSTQFSMRRKETVEAEGSRAESHPMTQHHSIIKSGTPDNAPRPPLGDDADTQLKSLSHVAVDKELYPASAPSATPAPKAPPAKPSAHAAPDDFDPLGGLMDPESELPGTRISQAKPKTNAQDASRKPSL